MNFRFPGTMATLSRIPVEDREAGMEQAIFAVCMVFGVAATALVAFTLLGIILGKVDV
ncbi:MAG: hypothetical protein AAFN50_12350 [Pseudomonadota bacterium]